MYETKMKPLCKWHIWNKYHNRTEKETITFKYKFTYKRCTVYVLDPHYDISTFIRIALVIRVNNKINS